MEVFNHRGPVIILTATAMLLLSLSLTQSWFTVQDTRTEGGGNGPSITTEHAISIHLRYYATEEWYGYPPSYDNLGLDSRISHLMGFMNSDLLFCIFLAWLVMMVAVLNSRLATLILGCITASACILTITVFSGRIPEAVRTSSESLNNWGITFITGLFGSRTMSSGTSLQTDEWSWRPGMGWGLSIAASTLLCFVIVLTLMSAYRDLKEYRARKELETEGAQVADSE